MPDNMQKMTPRISRKFHQSFVELSRRIHIPALQVFVHTPSYSPLTPLYVGFLCVFMCVCVCVCRGIPIRQGEYAWPAYSCDEWV